MKTSPNLVFLVVLVPLQGALGRCLEGHTALPQARGFGEGMCAVELGT